MNVAKRIGGVVCVAGLAAMWGGGGCTAENYLNLTKERQGNVTFLFINNTGYNAAFSFGTYDAYDKTPGTANFEQLRLNAHTTSAAVSVPCFRNAAVGTEDFINRVLATDANDIDGFDPDAFDTVVRFSDAPAGSDASGLPTAGTANGIERLLGVDYSCADQLIFTFNEDPDAPGGFRIDFEVIADDLDT